MASKTPAVKDQSKKLKILSDLLSKTQELGFQIRREKLKQGHGWRCMSGACLLNGQKVLFLDSKVSLDEQIFFLSSWLAGISEGADLELAVEPQMPNGLDGGMASNLNNQPNQPELAASA